MSFSRSFLLLSIVCLFSTAGLVLWGSIGNFYNYKGGYAAVAFDDTVEDKAIRARLNSDNAGLAKPFFSESSQWVMLDEFDSLAMIPLDEYSKRIEPFDPRNDGYAEKLRKMFVRDGKRFVFIPLHAGNSVPSILEKRLAVLFENVPFTVNYYGVGRPLKLFFLLYAAASASLLVICYAQKEKRKAAAFVIPLLPAMASLAFFGACGIGAASLLLGSAVLLMEPLKELLKALRLQPKGAQRRKTLIKKVFRPYMPHLLILPLFAAALTAVVFFSRLTAFFIMTVAIVVCALLSVSIMTLSKWRGSRVRFAPVLIINRKLPDYVFSAYMLPFAIAAFAAALFAPSMPGAAISNEKFDQFINEEDYYEHMVFQASFSARQLGKTDYGYPGYILDNDGLPNPDSENKADFPLQFDEFPSFPLKDLIEIISGVNAGKGKIPERGAGESVENFSLLILPLFIISGFLLKNKIFLSPASRFPNMKINEKPARTDIDRKKALLYNNRNNLRFLKDA
jgi:hypothetical protein